MDDAAPAPRAASTIRVINAKRSIADVTSLYGEELRSVLELAAAGLPPQGRAAVMSLGDLAKSLQIFRDRGFADPAETTMAEVALRQLLYMPEIIPVVRPSKRALRARAGIAKVVLKPNMSKVDEERAARPYLVARLAAEHPAEVDALMAVPAYQGGLVLESYGFTPRNTPRGLHPPPVQAVIDARKHPRLNVNAKPGCEIHPYSKETVERISAQLGADMAFFLGPGGVLATAARLRRDLNIQPAGAGGIFTAVVRTAAPGLPSPFQWALEWLLARLAESGTEVTSGPDAFVFSQAPLLDLYRAGALEPLLRTVAAGEGPPPDTAVAFLERVATSRAEQAQIHALERAFLDSIATARQYAIIAEDKFGSSRLGPAANAIDPAEVLAPLSKRERELVVTEYENRLAEATASAANSCPHTKLVRKIRAARSYAEAAGFLRELSAYFDSESGRDHKGPPTWLQCKSCSFRALCPHVRDLVEMQAAGKPYEAVRTRLSRYSSGGIGERSSDNYAYYCVVCCELLAEFVQEDRTAERLGAVGTLDDSLRKVVWLEALAAAEHVRFPTPVNPRSFAAAATDACHPLLVRAESTILRLGRRSAAKRSENSEIPPITRLYAILFVYAYVLNLIRSSQSSSGGGPSRRIEFEGVRPGEKLSAYAEGILGTILKAASGALAHIEDITPDVVATRFREAYRLLADTQGNLEIVAGDEPRLVVANIILFSPPYHYAATVARALGELPIYSSDAAAAAREEFEAVMGSPLPAVLADLAVESKSRIVQQLLGIRHNSRGGTSRGAVEFPLDADPFFVYGNREVNMLRDIYRPAAKKSAPGDGDLAGLIIFAGQYPASSDVSAAVSVGGREAAGRKAAKPPGNSNKPLSAKPPANKFMRHDPVQLRGSSELFRAAYQLFAEYTTDVVDEASMQRFLPKLENQLAAERGFLLWRVASSLKNRKVYAKGSSRQFASNPAPLTSNYDENGLPHTWAPQGKSSGNIYVYADGKEYTRADIAKLNNQQRAKPGGKKPSKSRQLVDVRCGTCGVLFSNTGSLDLGKVQKAIQAAGEANSFFAFYDSRCPAGGLHAYVDKICSNCDLPENISEFRKKDPAGARTYYDRNVEKFHLQRREVSRKDDTAAHQREKPSAADAEAAKFAETWQYDYSVIIQAANLAGIVPTAIEAIGATEGRDYSEVLAGTGIPPPPDSADDPRLTATDSAVRVFISAYNRLRFAAKFPAPPPEHEDVIAKSSVDISALSTLPGVCGEYSLRRRALMRTRSPADVLAFSIESIARMAVEVSKNTGPAAAAAALFAARHLREILRSEKLLSNPGPFNFKIFGDSDINAGFLGAGPGEAEGNGFGDINEEEAGSGASPFSLERVDLEPDDPNLEPQ